MDHFSFLCLVFLLLSRLFIAALWSPTGKGLTSWLLLMIIVFLLSSHVVSWVRCGTHDLCRLYYFYKKTRWFNFDIVNYPFLDEDVPHSPYISQHYMYMFCKSSDFNNRNQLLTAKLLKQN